MLLLCCKLSSTLILHSYRIDSNWSVRNIVVLNLRNNWLTDMLGLGLYNLPNLIELDLACNHFQGGVRPRSIPPSVQRLDLSFNDMHQDGIPDPDLCIRTAGEQRISNF